LINDLDIDSLSMKEILFEIEEAFDIEIKDSTWDKYDKSIKISRTDTAVQNLIEFVYILLNTPDSNKDKLAVRILPKAKTLLQNNR